MEGWKFSRLTRADFRMLQRAFIAALRDEVEFRFNAETQPADPLAFTPLVIAGLGSFKMRTRPARTFDSFSYAQNKSLFGNDGPRETVTKPPSRRLIFTAKWEPLP